jgi:hypothetical protein
MNSGMTERSPRRRFILSDDWTWWAWNLTAILLAIGLLGHPRAFVAAMGITGLQATVMLIREKGVFAFPVQLRIAYLMLLGVCFIPQMRWLYWLPTVGTLALVIFGYCLMARVLSLLPWNRREALSADLLRRTFFSRPDLSRLATDPEGADCAGGLCTIDAQVGPGKRNAGAVAARDERLVTPVNRSKVTEGHRQ